MADTEAKKIQKGLWASAGQRTDPDDSSLTPAIVRANGWPASFSAANGNTVRRRVMNQLLRELQGAALDSMQFGILPYDAEVNYRQYARCTVGAVEYSAVIANGPATSNATSPTEAGQNVWTVATGEVGVPAAPGAPTGTSPAAGQVDFIWNCPLDNGAAIASFDFQWRVSGSSSWSATILVTHPSRSLTGLTNGTAVQARVRARNSSGVSNWSATGSATPTATVPSGGGELALRGTAGNTQVSLDWLQPDTGGATISAYTVQWRSGTQNYDSGRQQTATSTTSTVTGLTNDTAYMFRVRATNSAGNSGWSNEVAVTPVAPPPPPTPPPADTAPLAPGTPSGVANGTAVRWEWSPPDDGGQVISSFDLQWRASGSNWSASNLITGLSASCREVTGLSRGTTYEARARALNSVGTGAWSSTGSFALNTTVAEKPCIVTTARGSSVKVVAVTNDNGGATISQYHVQWKSGSQAYSSSRQADMGSDGEHIVTGLTAGTAYTFRVLAVNARGNSAWSNDSSSTPVAELRTFTSAGTTTFTNPWDVTSLYVIAQGASGGAGGGGGASSINGNGGAGGGTGGGTGGGIGAAGGAGTGRAGGGGGGGANTTTGSGGAGGDGANNSGSGGPGANGSSGPPTVKGTGGGGGGGKSSAGGPDGGDGGQADTAINSSTDRWSGGGGGEAGADGGNSTITISSVVTTAAGGKGGGGGGGGGGVANGPAAAQNGKPGQDGDLNGTGGGGVGGINTNNSQSFGAGGAGGAGGPATRIQQTIAVTSGASIAVTVGAGGAGGAGGSGAGTAASGTAGSAGTAGSVTIIPVYT